MSPFPSIGSRKKDLVINADKSVDLWFGPTPPVGHETNWVQTVPGKGWSTVLRLYGPSPTAGSTRLGNPGEFEEVTTK